MIVWSKEAVKLYNEKTEEIEEGEEGRIESLEEKWKRLKVIVHDSMIA